MNVVALVIPKIILVLLLVCNNQIANSVATIPEKSTWADFKNLTGCHKGRNADGLPMLKKYFQHFGYLNSSYDNFSNHFDEEFEIAVRMYQRNFRINMTGELDNSTLNHIVRPRCGNPDIVNGSSTMLKQPSSSSSNHIHTVSRYSFFPNRPQWPPGKRNLTYAFLPENHLSVAVRSIFARAFQRWAQVVPMTFTETPTYSQADITIGFYHKNHGDSEPFDGILGVLAHAFSPPAGKFHLDADENWIINGDFTHSPFSGIDLESVVVHEMGHLLGLGHSSIHESIMFPSIASGVQKVELHSDDIAGIQELYGANPNYNGTNH